MFCFFLIKVMEILNKSDEKVDLRLYVTLTSCQLLKKNILITYHFLSLSYSHYL